MMATSYAAGRRDHIDARDFLIDREIDCIDAQARVTKVAKRLSNAANRQAQKRKRHDVSPRALPGQGLAGSAGRHREDCLRRQLAVATTEVEALRRQLTDKSTEMDVLTVSLMMQ